MGEPFKPVYRGQKRRDGLCRCGAVKPTGWRRCKPCNAKAVRDWRAKKKLNVKE